MTLKNPETTITPTAATATTPKKATALPSAPKKLWAQQAPAPVLEFTPTAWAKLLYLRDCGDCEVGGFGITSVENPLLVEDVVLVKQNTTIASVDFDDNAVAEFFDAQVDAGRKPAQFGRIWLHTHPGNSPQPSGTDEATFERAFGRTDWSVMFILAQSGHTYARLRFNAGPGGDIDIPVTVNYTESFSASDHAAWLKEYTMCVNHQPLAFSPKPSAVTISSAINQRRREGLPAYTGSEHDMIDDFMDVYEGEEFEYEDEDFDYMEGINLESDEEFQEFLKMRGAYKHV